MLRFPNLIARIFLYKKWLVLLLGFEFVAVNACTVPHREARRVEAVKYGGHLRRRVPPPTSTCRCWSHSRPLKFFLQIKYWAVVGWREEGPHLLYSARACLFQFCKIQPRKEGIQNKTLEQNHRTRPFVETGSRPLMWTACDGCATHLSRKGGLLIANLVQDFCHTSLSEHHPLPPP